MPKMYGERRVHGLSYSPLKKVRLSSATKLKTKIFGERGEERLKSVFHSNGIIIGTVCHFVFVVLAAKDD